jgi:hypothetical protein
MRVLAKKMANVRRNRTFFISLAMTGLRPSKAEAERRIDGDGADPEQMVIAGRRSRMQPCALGDLGVDHLAAVGL